MVGTERHHGADLAKWLGLVLMVLDHAWHVVPAEWQDVYGWVRVPGRLAFPIFCAVMAINVMRAVPGDMDSFIELYEAARARHPERWSGNMRNWVLAPIVCLNPEREAVLQQTSKAA